MRRPKPTWMTRREIIALRAIYDHEEQGGKPISGVDWLARNGYRFICYPKLMRNLKDKGLVVQSVSSADGANDGTWTLTNLGRDKVRQHENDYINEKDMRRAPTANA